MHDLIPTNDHFLAPVASIAHAVGRYQQMKEFVTSVLRDNVDFGIVPGTTKPTLLKPGAEKLATFFGLRPAFDQITVVEDWTGESHHGEAFFYYRYRCNLWRGEMKVADAEGSCNSWEKKYRYRQAERVCPSCGQSAIKRSKYPPREDPHATPGWYCFTKAGGCGANFNYGDAAIHDQQTGQVPNPNPADLVNTLQKMAQKRAYVAAVLLAVNGSEYFTQDLEDLEYGTPAEVIEGTLTPAPTPTPSPNGTGLANGTPRPWAPEKLKEKLLLSAQAHLDKGTTLPTLHRNLLAPNLESCFIGADDPQAHRKAVLQYLFQVDSLTKVTDPQALTLKNWLNVTQDSGGEYVPDAVAIQEAQAIYQLAAGPA